ncbi:hypothetical protein DFP72DRAFT_1059361 [Ephemerocybe angulata]|uniref:Uncharacterized protein n=1 Tax=Ephemerocybe angulata TaxID=980116 RepID=A0A8H6MDD9_9AGAR|nr:hypothetical protein DFP72DRAFT_1059361 [Tulosesus angulatus]
MPLQYRDLFAIPKAEEAQRYLNYHSSRIRSALKRMQIGYERLKPEEADEFCDSLLEEVTFTHGAVGYAALRFPGFITPPQCYRFIARFMVENGGSLRSLTAADISAALRTSSSQDPESTLAFHTNGWWNGRKALEKLDEGFVVDEMSIAQAWRGDRSSFKYKPTGHAEAILAAAADLDLMSSKELLDYVTTLEECAAMMGQEIVMTYGSMVDMWKELQRFEALVGALNNPDLQLPLIELEAPPVSMFSLST